MKRRLCALTAAALTALLLPAVPQAQEDTPSTRCDFIDPSVCLYPWPNDHFTKRTEDTVTGRRLALSRESMPANKDGVRIDPTDQNRADGFSPGSMPITKVPGLDTPEAAQRSNLPPIGDLSRSLAPRSPVVVVNWRTGKRHPVWAEIDSNPAAPEDRVLIIRPGRNFHEGGHYVVALRYLRDAAGSPLEAQRNFRLYRDSELTGDPLVERRRRHRAPLPQAEAGARVAQEPLPGMGLHCRESPEPRRAGAPHPRRDLRGAR